MKAWVKVRVRLRLVLEDDQLKLGISDHEGLGLGLELGLGWDVVLEDDQLKLGVSDHEGLVHLDVLRIHLALHCHRYILGQAPELDPHVRPLGKVKGRGHISGLQ